MLAQEDTEKTEFVKDNVHKGWKTGSGEGEAGMGKGHGMVSQ